MKNFNPIAEQFASFIDSDDDRPDHKTFSEWEFLFGNRLDGSIFRNSIGKFVTRNYRTLAGSEFSLFSEAKKHLQQELSDCRFKAVR